MVSKVFKYLIPVYIVWFIVHIVFFFNFLLSFSASNAAPRIGILALLFLSHFLVIIIGIALEVYMIVDCALRKFKDNSQKVLWLILIILFNIMGAIIYYYVYGKNPRK